VRFNVRKGGAIRTNLNSVADDDFNGAMGLGGGVGWERRADKQERDGDESHHVRAQRGASSHG